MVGERGVVILDRQVGRDGLMAAGAELALDQMPVPADVAGTVNQRVRRHRHDPQQGSGRFPIDL